MIAGHHLISTAYGWWLPNDPRGSMSREIRVAAMADLGELHYGRKRIQPAGREIREFRDAARTRLRHELLPFSEADIESLGAAFGHVIRKRNYTCYACAILHDHVHLLIRKHRDQAETMLEHLQTAGRDALHATGARPVEHPVWGGPGWKVFQETADDMQRTVAYIGKNLVQARRPPQDWPFVKPYDGWLPGQVRVVRRAHPPA